MTQKVFRLVLPVKDKHQEKEMFSIELMHTNKKHGNENEALE